MIVRGTSGRQRYFCPGHQLPVTPCGDNWVPRQEAWTSTALDLAWRKTLVEQTEFLEKDRGPVRSKTAAVESDVQQPIVLVVGFLGGSIEEKLGRMARAASTEVNGLSGSTTRRRLAISLVRSTATLGHGLLPAVYRWLHPVRFSSHPASFGIGGPEEDVCHWSIWI